MAYCGYGTMLCDSHTHLDQFINAELDGMIHRATEVGVGLIVTVGTTLESSLRAIDLARRHDIVYAGVGLHPMDLKAPLSNEEYAALRDLAQGHPKVVCISETGLDFLDTSPDRRWQEESFRRHIRLARELGLPVDFHARAAYEAILPIMREERIQEVGAIWHYYVEESPRAQEALDMGCYISLAKPLLREPALQEAVTSIPLERIVLETDSYPQPWKKNPARRTEPSHVVQVAEKLAEIKGVSLEEVAAVTTANLQRVLKLT